MSESSDVKRCCKCHRLMYSFVAKCSCGCYDFEKAEEKVFDIEGKSNVYVALPNGEKSYINKEIMRIFKPSVGSHTVAGYPILEDNEGGIVNETITSNQN